MLIETALNGLDQPLFLLFEILFKFRMKIIISLLFSLLLMQKSQSQPLFLTKKGLNKFPLGQEMIDLNKAGFEAFVQPDIEKPFATFDDSSYNYYVSRSIELATVDSNINLQFVFLATDKSAVIKGLFIFTRYQNAAPLISALNEAFGPQALEVESGVENVTRTTKYWNKSGVSAFLQSAGNGLLRATIRFTTPTERLPPNIY